jgi:hypothetical protein
VPTPTTTPTPPTTWYCRRGHSYTTVVPVTFVSCGQCNSDSRHRAKVNEMYPRTTPPPTDQKETAQ